MKKKSIDQKINYFMLIASITLLFGLNFSVHRAEHNSFKEHQTQYRKLLLRVLSENVELGLSIADKSLIDESIEDYIDYEHIFEIKIIDTQNNVISSFTNDANRPAKSQAYKIFNEDIIQQSSGSIAFEDIFSEESSIEKNKQKILGRIEVSMPSYNPFSTASSVNKEKLFANVILLIIMAVLWMALKQKTRKDQVDIRHITNIAEKNTLNSSKEMNSKETDRLKKLIIVKNQNAAQKDALMSVIENEVKQAREDGNVELHEFIDFISHFGIDNYQSQLETFYQSVLVQEHKEKTSVDMRKLAKQIITKYSFHTEQKNVNLFDNYTGKCLDHNVYIDEKLFSLFFDMFVKEIINVCEKHSIKLNLDVRETNKKNCMLRISVESPSPTFRQALKLQSLFNFDSEFPVSSSTNNINMISSKHIMQKAGGEFFYFKNEVRFEFPVAIEKSEYTDNSMSILQPLDYKLKTLVYDSDPIDRMVLMGYLDKFNLETDKATTKQVTLQKLRRREYHCLFVNADFFSEQDPYFIKNFRTEFDNNEHSTKIYVISSSDEIMNHGLFKRLQAVHIKKPIDLNALRNSLQQLGQEIEQRTSA